MAGCKSQIKKFCGKINHKTKENRTSKEKRRKIKPKVMNLTKEEVEH